MKAARRHLAVVGSLATLGLIGAFLADRAVGRHQATQLARQLRVDAAALASCMYGASLPVPDREERVLRDRLGRQAPDEAPFAGCVPATLALESGLHHLGATRHRRSGDRAAQVDVHVDALAAMPLQGTGQALQPRVSELTSALRATLAGACEVASLEEGVGTCLPAPRPASARPSQVALDEPTTSDTASWVVTAGTSEISLRAASAGHAWEARSSDGRRFVTRALPGEGRAGEDAPQLLDESPTGHRLVRALAPDTAIEVSGEAVSSRMLPPLPPGVNAAPLGVRALETPEGWASVGRDASGRGVLSWGTGASQQAPGGELLGAFQQGGARLLIKRRAPSGFVELVTVPVSGPRGPWAAGLSAVVSYVPALDATADIERRCGLPDERFSTWVGTHDQDATLIAGSSEVLHAYRFRALPGTSYRVICGSCPPMALEASRDGLGLFVPVRRSLTPARLTTPLLFEPGRSDATAQAACTTSALAVVYEARGQIVVQRREEQGWRFEPPVVIAETDERGRPEAPAIVGVGETLVVFWRRLTPGRLRIESRRLDEVPREPLPLPVAPDPSASSHRGRGVDPG